MSFNIVTTTDVENVANFIADSILDKIKSGKQVLFFVTGGSSISVGVKVARLLQASPDKNLENLTITLTDERYGPLDHPDSNWHLLIEKGFSLPQSKLIPILTVADNDRANATLKFNQILEQELETTKENKYKIGLFGIGADGHTAGILPNSIATECADFACGYDTFAFSRITMTPKAIEKLDEAVAFVQGENKWSTLQDLQKDIEISKQPAQVLKKVPKLTIFTDYHKS